MMIQFSEEEVKSFKCDSRYNDIVALLKSSVATFQSHPMIVPHTGIASWTHYYFCPDCSVELIMDIDKSLDHECPCCHKVFTGNDDMDGAWWRKINTWNEQNMVNIGLLYMLTDDMDVAAKAIDVLMEYARYYEGYEIHGNIPYNGPGKLNAQTLDESNSIRRMAYAYDLLQTAMTEEQRDFVKTHLFRPAIEFLRAHRNDQLHNHEVICDGAIGVLALVLDDMEMLDFAINSKYGIIYQLEHGTLEDNYWFECSTCYHLYALQNLLLYEKFARLTRYSNLNHPNYLGMITSILRIQKSDLSFPLLNDCHIDQAEPNAYDLFEFAYATWKDDRILQILHKLYEKRDRLSIESFFYGVKTLPPCKKVVPKGNLKGENGLGASIIRRGKDYLLFRHGPYGGEHDHYDRLGLSYYYDNVPVSIDMGTTGYGAPLHYAYYKRTNTHNTVTINGGNQAPSAGKLLDFREEKDMVLVKAETVWIDDYQMPDSFTILQWDEESYRNVRMERTVVMTDYGFIDHFIVENASSDSVIDLNMHFHGNEEKAPETEGYVVLGNEKPYIYFHDGRQITENGVVHSVFENRGVVTDVFYSLDGCKGILSESFDNPSNRDMHYITRRTEGGNAEYYSFVSSNRVDRVVSVTFDGAEVHIVTESGVNKVFRID